MPSRPEPVLDGRVHQRREEIQQLLARLAAVQEEERRRVARDLHDQLGQPMTALRMQIEALELRAGADPTLAAAVERTMQLAADLDRSIDFFTSDLRPEALERLDLSTSLSELVRSWSERFNIPADYHAEAGPDHALAADASVHVYRIVQEALHNVHKHAQASRVTVLFTQTARRPRSSSKTTAEASLPNGSREAWTGAWGSSACGSAPG